MLINEIFGKTITNIYVTRGTHDGWLDTAYCFIELDRDLVIDFPNGYSEEVNIVEVDENAHTIFGDLSDYPVYYVNKEGKSIQEMTDSGDKYKVYKVELEENKLKYIPNRKIIDFLWYPDEAERGYLLLDNGFVITETTMSPMGTGLAGLNYYQSIEALEKTKGKDYNRIHRDINE